MKEPAVEWRSRAILLPSGDQTGNRSSEPVSGGGAVRQLTTLVSTSTVQTRFPGLGVANTTRSCESDGGDAALSDTIAWRNEIEIMLMGTSIDHGARLRLPLRCSCCQRPRAFIGAMWSLLNEAVPRNRRVVAERPRGAIEVSLGRGWAAPLPWSANREKGPCPTWLT